MIDRGERVAAAIAFKDMLSKVPCLMVDDSRAVPIATIRTLRRGDGNKAEIETLDGDSFIAAAQFDPAAKALTG